MITHSLIHTFQPKCGPRGEQQGSGDFCNEVLEYHSPGASMGFACSFTRGRWNVSLSLSFSLLEWQPEKIVDSRHFDWRSSLEVIPIHTHRGNSIRHSVWNLVHNELSVNYPGRPPPRRLSFSSSSSRTIRLMRRNFSSNVNARFRVLEKPP